LPSDGVFHNQITKGEGKMQAAFFILGFTVATVAVVATEAAIKR